MVSQTLRHTDCDRCGSGFTGSHEESPLGWTGLTFVRPLLAEFDPSERLHICDVCSIALSRFLNNKEVRPRE